MKLGKKLLSGVAVTVACATLATVTAFANSSSTSAGAYGTLSGDLYNIMGTTKINYNPDNAYLAFRHKVTDANGTQIYTFSERSDNGAIKLVSLSYGWDESIQYAAFGTHGVQGGSVHAAQAVYTYTKF